MAPWQRIARAVDERLARMPAALPGGILFAGERLKSVAELWDGMTHEEQREACGLLFERVALDTRVKQLLVKPWVGNGASAGSAAAVLVC